jgi:hypothetical protein
MVYSAPFEVGSVAVEKMKGRQKKQKQMVVPANRRFTRSQLALDGHRAPPTPGLPAKRRRRAKKSAEVAEAAVAPQGSTGQANPSIPIGTLQHIGHMLDIDEAELTVEKLMADPKNDVPPSVQMIVLSVLVSWSGCVSFCVSLVATALCHSLMLSVWGLSSWLCWLVLLCNMSVFHGLHY